MPTICVIIPTMNRRDMLKEALDSVARQTRPCDRVIVIDAGEDGSDRLCADYSFVHYMRQATRGLTPARNEALAQATEDYVGMLDSDDFYEPQFLEVCGSLLDGEADVVYSQGFRLTQNKREAILVNHQQPANILKALVADNCVIASFALLRRECLMSINGYREGLALADDYDLYLHLAIKGFRFKHAPLPLSNRRHHEGSLTLSRPDANVRAIRDILLFHQDALCLSLNCSPQQLLSGCELRLGRLFYELRDSRQSIVHLKRALAGSPLNWRIWAYLLAGLTAPYSFHAFETSRRWKRSLVGLFGRLGLWETRW